MNERKPTWNCPVCDSKALYDTLLIDGYFQDILDSRQLPADDNDVILERDGTWKPVPKEEEKSQEGEKKNGGKTAGNDDNVDFIDLSDDENDIPLPPRPPLPSGTPLCMSLPPLPPPPPQEIECIDLD
jgi:hypothetical protein